MTTRKKTPAKTRTSTAKADRQHSGPMLDGPDRAASRAMLYAVGFHKEDFQKNVIGIAAGALDGMGYSSLKGALMARGAREVARLIKAMGGNELSAYGLCHLGDYEATLFSLHSHNRMFGEQLARGKSYDKLAEGYYTVLAMVKLGKEYKVDLPICQMVEQVLYEHYPLEQTLPVLFARTVKGEFDA